MQFLSIKTSIWALVAWQLWLWSRHTLRWGNRQSGDLTSITGRQSCVTKSVAFRENCHQRHSTPWSAAASSSRHNNNNYDGKSIEKSNRRSHECTEKKPDLRAGYAACWSHELSNYSMDNKQSKYLSVTWLPIHITGYISVFLCGLFVMFNALLARLNKSTRPRGETQKLKWMD